MSLKEVMCGGAGLIHLAIRSGIRISGVSRNLFKSKKKNQRPISPPNRTPIH